MTVGQNVRKTRQEKGLSILQVREITGLSKSTISEIENDKSSPTVETLKKIADALNTNVEDFFKADNSVKEASAVYMSDDEFTSPEQALKFVLNQPVIMNYGEYDLNKLSEVEIIDLANDMLFAMKLSLEKRKRDTK